MEAPGRNWHSHHRGIRKEKIRYHGGSACGQWAPPDDWGLHCLHLAKKSKVCSVGTLRKKKKEHSVGWKN